MSQKCHFIGIGGIGMSGLARIMLSKEMEVSGSDLATTYITEGLSKQGAKVFLGQSENHITKDMTVVYSTDIKKDNPEYRAALELKCPMLHRSDLLLELMRSYRTLSVTGTHGKTTTSSLLTTVLIKAGVEPSFAVGGIIPEYQTNAGHGNGKYFVAEADESDGTFLKYNSYGAIVTNIDLDHMNHFSTEENLIQAFKAFISQVESPEHLFWCGDDRRLKEICPPGFSYGFSEECALRASNYSQKGWNGCLDIAFKGKKYESVEIPLVGYHNALNSLAVFGLCLMLGIEEKAIREGLKSFKGVLRRCEKKGEEQGILFLDDYAHHPTEIETTLKGIRNAVEERRLVVVFQPHRYSRTQDCLGTYRQVFSEADELFVTEIFAAGETPIPGLSHERIIQEISPYVKGSVQDVSRRDLAKKLIDFLRPHDVVVTLGAGDITKLCPEIITELKKKTLNKWTVGVIFGGRSAEHEISLRSARFIAESLDKRYYQLEYFSISKEGVWQCETEPGLVQKQEAEKKSSLISFDVLQKLCACDVLFPVLHGPYGEDGTIQGFFEMIDKPYVGCDNAAAALSMNKALTKEIMLMNGLPTAPFIAFSHYEWKQEPERIKQEIREALQLPIFVKPVRLGSSIGITKVESFERLEDALEEAFKFDARVLVENGIAGREIEFALLGNDRLSVFPPGEILTEGKVYDYESKYGIHGFQTLVQADLPQKLIDEGMEIAKWAYRSAGCSGLARIDFFLDKQNKFWVSEINPIPGFTRASLYPKICEANGITASQLMDRLIVLAFEKKRNQRHLK
jgi:UDP-N-acetylmuramate--alanine ligase